MNEKEVYFTGIDATSGNYLQEPLSDLELARILTEPATSWRDLGEERDLKWWNERYAIKDPLRRPARGVDPKDLSSSGWGIIYPENISGDVRKELAPLVEHRRAQAASKHENYFRELNYISGESKDAFFKRLGVEPGPANPEQLPYYLLIVGDPTAIPYNFQYLLDMQYAVGRISFDTPEEYGRYADSVVRCERGESQISSDLALFSVSHQEDKAAKRLNKKLVRPLSKVLADTKGQRCLRVFEKGGKRDLSQLIGGEATPAFLFTAAHGLSFQSGHPSQEKRQGAILCQEWPGPGSPPENSQYFSELDVSDNARLLGLVAFHFGCFSAGTPESTNYPTKALRNPSKHAPKPLISPLAKRLLSHPNGGALAVLGHVDRVWSLSFGSGHGKGYYHFESFLKDMLGGRPVGSAMDWLNERFAELSTQLTDGLEKEFLPGVRAAEDDKPDPRHMARLWRANNDARNFILLGDPAVRLVTSETAAKAGASQEQTSLFTRAYRRLRSRSAVLLSKPAAVAIHAERVFSSEASAGTAVIDASALVELLLRTDIADAVEAEIKAVDLHAPHVIDLEVAQALRHYLDAGDIDSERARLAMSDLASLPITRHSAGPMLARVVELQEEMPVNEAAYLALAGSLSAPLLTCDRQLGLCAQDHVQTKLIGE